MAYEIKTKLDAADRISLSILLDALEKADENAILNDVVQRAVELGGEFTAAYVTKAAADFGIQTPTQARQTKLKTFYYWLIGLDSVGAAPSTSK